MICINRVASSRVESVMTTSAAVALSFRRQHPYCCAWDYFSIIFQDNGHADNLAIAETNALRQLTTQFAPSFSPWVAAKRSRLIYSRSLFIQSFLQRSTRSRLIYSYPSVVLSFRKSPQTKLSLRRWYYPRQKTEHRYPPISGSDRFPLVSFHVSGKYVVRQSMTATNSGWYENLRRKCFKQRPLSWYRMWCGVQIADNPRTSTNINVFHKCRSKNWKVLPTEKTQGLRFSAHGWLSISKIEDWTEKKRPITFFFAICVMGNRNHTEGKQSGHESRSGCTQPHWKWGSPSLESYLYCWVLTAGCLAHWFTTEQLQPDYANNSSSLLFLIHAVEMS